MTIKALIQRDPRFLRENIVIDGVHLMQNPQVEVTRKRMTLRNIVAAYHVTKRSMDYAQFSRMASKYKPSPARTGVRNRNQAVVFTQVMEEVYGITLEDEIITSLLWGSK